MARCSLGQAFEDRAYGEMPLDVPEKIRVIAWDLNIPFDVLFKWSVGDFWGGNGARAHLLRWWLKLGHQARHDPQAAEVMIALHEAVAEGARRRRRQLSWSWGNLPTMIRWYVTELRMRSCANEYRDPPRLRFG